MASGIAVWLGGTDAAKEGTWQWLTGEAWSYQNWASGEPNNAGGGENFLMMNFPGKTAGSWNDYGGPGNNSTKTVAYLCEWDSPYTCDKDCPAPFVKMNSGQRNTGLPPPISFYRKAISWPVRPHLTRFVITLAHPVVTLTSSPCLARSPQPIRALQTAVAR